MKKIFAFAASTLLCAAVIAQQQIVIVISGLTQATPPSFSPNGGTFHSSPQAFTLTSPDGGTVGYTSNGLTPTLTNVTLCASPCALSSTPATPTWRAISIVSGKAVSTETDATFTFTVTPTATPTMSPDPGPSTTTITVTVNDTTALATLYCTQDGTQPNAGSPSYSVPATFTFNTPGTVTLLCGAQASGFAFSGIFGGNFSYNPPGVAPTIAPAPGPYTASVTVTITDPSCPSAPIYYSTTGAPSTSSTLYTGPFTLTQSANVQAMDVCPNYSPSPTASANYTINPPTQAPTPTFMPMSGTQVTTPTTIPVQISGIANATIIYTTNGTQPTLTNGTSCTPAPCGPTLSAVANYTVLAIETVPGYTTSAVGSSLYSVVSGAPAGACSGSSGVSGTLHVILNASPRTSGTSPLLAFYDATATTDSATLGGANNPYQDVTYTWNYGDSGASGSGVWLYGSNPNKNNKNMATGAVGAHLYITSGTDVPYTATVTANDGTYTVTCTAPPVTAYDPTDAPPNGFGGTATTCVSAAALPVQGVGGCPAGAAVLQSASYATAIGSAFGNDKRVLFHCTETFAGGLTVIRSQHGSIGSYGSCPGTQSGRPIFTGNSGGNLAIGSGSSADFDIRIADLDLEGGGNTGGTAIYGNSSVMPYQVTVWNTLSNGNAKSFYDYNASQIGLVQFQMTGMGNFQGVYVNNSENQCTNNSGAYGCGGAGFVNINYQALLGSQFNGAGVTNEANGIETVRISACRLCVIEDNTFENANTVGAVLKFHNGNKNSQAGWTGQYTELSEISDNLFTGISGAQLVELAPQNSQTDERLRGIIFERNLMLASSGSCQVLVSGMNMTLRDNVSSCHSGNSTQYPFQIARRGVEYGDVFTGTSITACTSSNPNSCSGNSGAPFFGANTIPEYVEAYNNTGYQQGANGLIGFVSTGCCFYNGGNSWAQNNLLYNASAGATVANSGTGNTVNNNTTTTTANPGFSNGSGSFSILTDFVPSAPVAGIAVPVFFDALGVPWAPIWNLGAVSAQGPPAFKFFAGDAAMSSQYQHNESGGQVALDVAALAANPVPGGLGHQMYVAGWHWPSLESGSTNNNSITEATNGTGQFAGFPQILTAYTQLEAAVPGAYFGISIMGNVYGGNYSPSVITTRPWDTTGKIVPSYIAVAGGVGVGTITVPTSFGASGTMTCQVAPLYTAASYGGFALTTFDGTDMQTGVPAFWNPCIAQAYANFWQALSKYTYVAPSGHPHAGTSYTLDTDPQIVLFLENSEYTYDFQSGSANNPAGVTVSPPLFTNAQNTPSNTNAIAGYKLWAQGAAGAFPHTPVAINFTFGFNAQHGADTPANMAGYINQNIAGGALSTIQGLAYSAADTFATNWITPFWASCGIQGFAGISNASAPIGCNPTGLGTVNSTTLTGYTELVAQVQPTDYSSRLPSGVSCTSASTISQCSAGVTAISNAANNSYVQASLRLWNMFDGPNVHSGDNGTWAWTHYIAPTLNGTLGAGVTPYSTTPPSNLPTTSKVVFFTQPAINSAAGNTYIAGANGFLYNGTWLLDSVEPTNCPGGSDPSGLFPTAFNPVSLTGLSSTSGNLSYSSGTGNCTSPQSSASTIQALGSAMGTYINSADVACLAGSPPICKDGMFPEIWWAKPSTTPTGLTNPFVNYNNIQINFWVQVPTATWPGMPAVGNTQTTGASYGAFDLAFEDLNGNQIVFDAGFFFGGQAAQTKCLTPVQDNQGGTAWEIKFQIASAGCTNPYGTGSSYYTWLAGAFSSTTFTGYQQFTYTITQANFQQALNDIKAHGANVPANFSTNVNTWGMLHGHFNDECYHISGPCTLGTSEHDLTITFF